MADLIVMAALKVVFILVASIHISDGDLRFASSYGDHMVLQKLPERAVLWGYGSDGAQVTVSLSGPTTQNTSVSNVTKGIWRVTLDPVEAGGPYNVTVADQNSTATLTDVLFGDIWLCSGQSNMQFETFKLFNASWELSQAEKYPHVRPFMVAMKMSRTEETDLIQVALPWSVPSAKAVAKFSGLCWLFGRYMYEHLKYPIGLVESCWGGTAVEAWSSPSALLRCGLEEFSFFHGPENENSVLWNAMIHPLLSMTIKGAIWYQGETNSWYHQEQYKCSFPAMIDDWRMAFHRLSGGQTANDFPFGFVQGTVVSCRSFELSAFSSWKVVSFSKTLISSLLPEYRRGAAHCSSGLSTFLKDSKEDGFPNIRWHQTADTGFAPNPRMKKTFMAVAMDLPDETSPYGTIHPRDKRSIAYRLTLGARAVAYNQSDVPFQGPFPDQIVSTLNYVNVSYDQPVSVAQSTVIFEVCCPVIPGQCGPKSYWVAAPIIQWDATTVQLSTKSCPVGGEVAALRYAWRDWPCDFKACPIYSSSGILPAPPFIISRSGATGNIWESN